MQHAEAQRRQGALLRSGAAEEERAGDCIAADSRGAAASAWVSVQLCWAASRPQGHQSHNARLRPADAGKRSPSGCLCLRSLYPCVCCCPASMHILKNSQAEQAEQALVNSPDSSCLTPQEHIDLARKDFPYVFKDILDVEHFERKMFFRYKQKAFGDLPSRTVCRV